MTLPRTIYSTRTRGGRKRRERKAIIIWRSLNNILYVLRSHETYAFYIYIYIYIAYMYMDLRERWCTAVHTHTHLRTHNNIYERTDVNVLIVIYNIYSKLYECIDIIYYRLMQHVKVLQLRSVTSKLIPNYYICIYNN